MLSKINAVRNIMEDKGLEGILIYKPENRRYFSGFTGTTGFIIITKNEAKFITDFRYIKQAEKECTDYDIVEISRSEPLTSLIKNLKLKSLGVEEDFFTYGDYLNLNSSLSNLEIVPLNNELTNIRAIKTDLELKNIKQAAHLADEAFKHVLKFIKPGACEKDIALELEFFMRKKGATSASFNFIVASGKRSAFPHGVASDKLIENGDFVTLDYGCVYKGYCSDMTRTVVVGKADKKQKEIYSIVLKAQETALESVRPGITGKELDQIARNIITEEGYGKYFGHGLGHGVGLEIHELPHINSMGNEPIKPNMVLTIEPGIYIPDFGGVRIEDLVLVKENGYEILSNTSKRLMEI